MNNTCTVKDLGIELDFSRLDLPDDLGDRYASQIQSAQAEMAAIEAGELVNRSEQRQVGHYWLRAPELGPGDVGSTIQQAWQQMQTFADVKGKEFKNILWLGIGGSGLGPQMLYDVMRVPGQTPSMFFFDNTDPYGMHRTLQEVQQAGGLDQTLTVVVSKSGGTPETANGLKVARHEYVKAGLSFGQHAAAVTGVGSWLDQVAKGETPVVADAEPEAWLDSFPLWDWVGGRTSIFSAVGLLPANLLHFDAEQFIAGGRKMDEATRAADFAANPALLLATAWFHLVETRGLSNMVVLPYCDRICLLSKYLQQLVMESLGKDGKGITVLGNKGSTDQHSYVQQLRDGLADFFAMFLRVLDPECEDWEVEPGVSVGDYLMAFQEGTARALTETGRPSLRITIEHMKIETLGALIALFERTVGYYGAMLGINSYDQPGVEAGKKAASALLKQQAEAVGGKAKDDWSQDVIRRLNLCGRLPE